MKENTVFILGAGASMPYGFPSGLELKKLIIVETITYLEKNATPGKKYYDVCAYDNMISNMYSEVLEEIRGNERLNGIFEVLNKYDPHRVLKHFTLEQIRDFILSFIFSGTNSIDSFLANNKGFEALGSVILTYIISILESYSNIYTFNDSWYNYLVNDICKNNIDVIHKSTCTFITFNYDRSLEEYLIRSFSYSMNISRDEVCDSLEFIHMYGDLGKLEYGIYKKNSNIDLLSISKNISFIRYDDNEPTIKKLTNEQTKAKERIANATQLVILGFGFDINNINLLFGELPIANNDNFVYRVEFDGNFVESKIDYKVAYTCLGIESLYLSHILRKYEFLNGTIDGNNKLNNFRAETNSSWSNSDLLRNSSIFNSFIK